MPRPVKTGLDYFPLDVNIEDNIELIEAKHGLQSFAIVVKLWQKIYSNGYYYEWNEDNALLFSRKINIDLSIIDSVISSCFERNIFNKSLYSKYKILTSNGIQKRYLTACSQSKRKYIPFIEEYLIVNSELTEVITEFTSINSEFSTQRKGKEIERKGKHLSEQREFFLQILEIFYFKNYKNPEKVTTTFFNHYEKIGWKDKNGNTIENPLAAAANWENKTTDGKNCPEKLLNAWKQIYEQCKESIPDYHLLLFIRPIQFHINDKTLKILGNKNVIEKIENNIIIRQELKKALIKAFGEKISVEYQLDV